MELLPLKCFISRVKNIRVVNCFNLICINIFLTSISVSAQVQTLSSDSATKRTGFISVTATITYKVESPEKKLLDSLQWGEQKLIVKKYAGKKIKQILFQKYTGRVVVFFHGQNNLEMDKATAVSEGLLMADPVIKKREKKSFLPLNPIQIYIDSPLYIGTNNLIKIWGPDTSDIIIPLPGTLINYAGIENEYRVTVTTPGTVVFVFKDSVSKKEKYICHGLVKRLPGDDLVNEPELRLGNIRTLTASPELLMKQNELFVGNGFSISGGTAYFTGTGFKSVIITVIDKKLTYMKPYIDLCLPGSQISFDNITVRDPSGKIFSVKGFYIQVTDDIHPPALSVDYYSITSYPEFISGDEGLKYFVKEQLAAIDKNDLIAENKKVGLIFKIEADGSVSPISDMELSKWTKFERRCFDIIKNGPKWQPGKFKEKNSVMVVTYSDDFN